MPWAWMQQNLESDRRLPAKFRSQIRSRVAPHPLISINVEDPFAVREIQRTISRVRKTSVPRKFVDLGSGSGGEIRSAIRRPGVYDHHLVRDTLKRRNALAKKSLFVLNNQSCGQ